MHALAYVFSMFKKAETGLPGPITTSVTSFRCATGDELLHSIPDSLK